MKKINSYRSVLALVFVLLQNSLMAQVVTLQPATHIGAGEKLAVSAITLLDTTSRVSGPIACVFVINDKAENKSYTLSLNSKGTGFDNSKLYTSARLNPGFHSVFIKFSDTAIKAYSLLISAHLKTSATPNITERLKYRTTAQDADDLLNKLKAQIGSLKPAFLATLPKGLKCLVAIDLFCPQGFDLPTDTVYCATTQYEIIPSTVTVRTPDLFVRNLIGGATDSPLFILLSSGWQMRSGQFDGNAAAIKNEVFGHNNYEEIKSADPAVDAHLTVITKTDDNNFRRILLYLDN